MKTAIIVFSDPKAGSDEALGRVFNALAAAYDFKTAGEEVRLIFQGAGSRWPAELQKENHPAHELFKALKENVQGISSGCADVFGANTAGFDLIKNNPVPNTSGVSSFRMFNEEGFQTLIF